MKILAIVCPVIRHQYTFNVLAEKIPFAGVIKQHKVRKCVSREMTQEEEDANKKHFMLRDEAEERWLGEIGRELNTDRETKVLEIHSNTLDIQEVDEFIDSISPDVIITLGSGLVKKEVLDKIQYGLNFHLGMSPRYRGGAGFFWPIYNMDPERIGASILVLEDNIDGGSIVHHSRPDISVGDSLHDIAAKTIIKGAKEYSEILHALFDGHELIAIPQKSAGRVHYEAAYHPRHLVVADFLMSSGVIENYLGSKEERDKYVYLVKFPQL